MLVWWASAFPAIRVAVRAYPPGELALLRYLTASLALLFPTLVLRLAPPRRDELPLLAVTGFLGFTVYNVALNAGEITMQAGAASFLVNSAPVFTVLLAILLLREKPAPTVWLGVFLSTIGVVFLSLGKSGALHFGHGTGLVLLASASAGLYVVLQKKLLQRRAGEYSHLPEYARALRSITHIIWAGTLFLLIFSPDLPRAISAAPLSSTLAVIYMGIFPGALAYAIWSWVLSRIPVSVAVNFLYGIPVFAALISWLWLGETLGWRAILGGAFVLCGVIVVNKKRAK